MLTPQEINSRIETALAELPYPEAPDGLYNPIEYALESGGKRLRPTLLLMAYGLYADDISKAMPAAVGIETYHNHTLLHDDLMDRAELRRGRPAVRCKWDDNTAILSGDTMLILAFRHVLSCRCRQQDALSDLFAQTAQEVCEGQQYDMNFERRSDVSIPEYVKMIRLKTAVLLACAAKMGALIADAPVADADALYAFAERVGLAFQLQDDYLDVYGDPAVFGKKTGGDILTGKKTFLLLTAREKADSVTRQRLDAILADQKMPAAEKIAAVTAIYDAIGVGSITQEAIEHFYADARQTLGRVGLPSERLKPLWDYTETLLGRKK